MKLLRWTILVILVLLIFQTSLAASLVSSPEKNYGIKIDIQHSNLQDYINDWHVDHNNSNKIIQSFTNCNKIDDEKPVSKNCIDIEQKNNSTLGPMKSAWPMQGHDMIHTCRSSYSTKNNSGAEIWRVRSDRSGEVEGSAIIDHDGIIYFGTLGSDSSLYALYPNSTKKWKFKATDLIWGTPAIAEDGVIYCTTWGQYLLAVNPDGTGKWIFNQESISTSSPTIGEDGTIYFGTDGHNIFAINPNGTEKWRYVTSGIVMASPAIGNDGTIYIGSCDHFLYTLNPNGTLRWRFNTGDEIKGDASIGEDGTIYVPSFNGYFYALSPNGTLKWQASTGDSVAAAGVALDENGIIYVGTEQLRAYYPNGTLKWCTDVHGSIYGTVPAVSSDGTIYVSAGGSLVAVNSDGIEKWRKQLSSTQILAPPCIGPDDRVYVGSEDPGLSPHGYLHAFGIGPLRSDTNGPYSGTALRPTTLTGLVFGGTPPYQYHWDLGDGNTSTEINPTHTYIAAGNYTATFTVTDSTGNTSIDTTTVTMDYPYPTLTITKPTNAFYINDKKLFRFPFPFILGKITVQVSIQDHYDINRVDFIIHGSSQYTDTTPPYEWTWTQSNFRIKDNIYVIAWDNKGRYAEQMMDVIKWF